MVYRRISDPEFKELAGRILYEDNHLFIVYKQVGDIVQGDKTGDECLIETYQAFIAQRDNKPGKVFLAAAHRLDRPVCGICILAKTSKSLERLAEMFQKGEVHKKYWALSCAKPEPDENLLEGWIYRDSSKNKSFIVGDGNLAKPKRYDDAKLARLKYKYLYSTQRYHLIEVELLTGRHHQIRCQLSKIGCPIKGDLKYGAPRSNPDGGICLQAHEISFIHPVKKEPITLTVPPPADWKGIQS